MPISGFLRRDRSPRNDNSSEPSTADLTLGVDTRYFTIWLSIKQQPLDRTFAALADPTRRALLARLGEHDSVSVSELARPFPVSLPAIMKHLDVLSDAGLITRAKTGRTVACRLSAAPMEQAMEWLNRYQRFWSTQLDRLAAFVEEDACLPDPNLLQAKSASPIFPSRAPRKAQPHPQTSSQCAAVESLRGLDRPGKASAVVRAGRHRRRIGQRRA